MKNLQEQQVEKVEVEEIKTSSEENENVETIIIDDEDVEFQDSDEEEVLKVTADEPTTSKRDFVKEVKDLSEAEDEKIEKILEKEEKSSKEEQGKVVDLLTRFKEYISKDKFEKKCDDIGNKYNLNGSSVKNLFVKNTLGTIADILNLSVSIIGDIVLGVSNFINIIICNIATYTSKSLHKVINILTLNCGEKQIC